MVKKYLNLHLYQVSKWHNNLTLVDEVTVLKDVYDRTHVLI